MSDILLPTKFLIPRIRLELVTRSRLFQQLNDGLHKKLTLVSAPAGFGKTTLIAEWVNNFTNRNRFSPENHVIWLSLNESDNDFNRFLIYFFTAFNQLKRADINQEKEIQEMLQSPNLPPIETIFSPLMFSLSSIDKKIIFVLDDYHLIEDLTIHKALNFWLENAPPQVHTIVITREDPPFPLARLRVRNHLSELRAADLRFTEPEAQQFLNEIMGLHLNAEFISKLEERTEGWIAGLQMAALSMRDRKDITAFIENFSGTNRYILDYLLEEVLANQSAEIQAFLLHTSILKRLSASLCDAVLEEENQSNPILEYLEQANLFLIPLDDERNWYRYHHLFSDLLTARLQQTHSSKEVSDLHRRAAHWYDRNVMAYGAIYHASLIPDDKWVEQLIDQNYMEIFQRKDSAAIRNWTGELGKELIFKRPQLAIHEANSRAWFGQLDEAEHLLNEAEKRLQAQDSTPEVIAMYGYLAYVRGRVTAMRGDFHQAIKLCLSARENTPDNNQGLLGGIGVMLGYGYFLNGEFSQAIQVLEETIHSGKKTGAINTTIGAYCVLARLYAIQGRLQKANNLYREAEKFIQQSEGEHRGTLSIVHVGFAEICYEWNDLEGASAFMQHGLEFISLWKKADDIVMALILQAQIQQAQDNMFAASKNIIKGSQIIQTSGVFSETRNAVSKAEIELDLRQKNNLAISRWIKSTQTKLTSDESYSFDNELIRITLARVHLSQNHIDEGLKILTQLETSAQTGGRKGRLIKILILQALGMDKKGEAVQAYSFLERALVLAEPEHYVRTFLDEGQPMQQLLKHWLAENKTSHLNPYASYLVSQFENEKKSETEVQSKPGLKNNLIEELSPREIEVLNLIALGKTNKEISQELVVSPGTIKAHTSNIYRKLDVTNRTEAVSRARELNILS